MGRKTTPGSGTTRDRNSQGAIKKKRVHLRALLDALPDFIWLKDPDGVYVTCNPEFERVCGARESEIIGKTDYDLVDKDLADFFRKKDMDAMAAGHPVHNEEWVTYASDGRRVLVETTKTPVYDAKGNLVGVLGIARNITDRRRIEEELRAAEQRYRTLAKGSFEGIVVIEQGRYVDANEQFLEMLGVSRDELIGRELIDFLPPEDHDRILAIIGGRSESRVEHRMVRKDGRVILVEAHGQGIEIDGRPARMAAIRDITERRQAEEAIRQSEARLRRAELVSKCGNWELHLDSGKIVASDGSLRIYGLSGSVLDYTEAKKQCLPEYRPILDEARINLIEHNAPYDVEFKIKTADTGETKVIRSLAEFDKEKRIIFGVIEDITRQKITEETLRASEERYRGLVESQSEFLVRLDLHGCFVFANRAFCDAVGKSVSELAGQLWTGLCHPEDVAVIAQGLAKALNGPEYRATAEARVNAANGSRWVAWEGCAIFDKGGDVIELQAVGRDITEHKKSKEKIWQQTNFDTLTGLPNRRMLRDRLEQEIKKSRRTGLPVALMFIDLDRFKEINDTLGHEKGDALLQEVARRLRGCVRESDTVGRPGGDEFIVILGDLEDIASVERVAGTILQRMAAPCQLDGDLAYVSASIGITLYPEDATEVGGLFKNADQAMYESKKLGRNRFNYFKPSMQAAAMGRVHLINDLRAALAENQFRVYYQPIVDLRTGEIRKAEALIRWQHPTRGLISPAEFIPIAEETGLIVEIGEWVFRQAASQAASWQSSQAGPIQISVNKSPVQFREGGSCKTDWGEHLLSLGLKGDSIAVEITEGLLLDASDAVNEALLRFRDSGVQVSLDDFGTGYSSLSYLKKFDIDYLKIDQSFVRGLSNDSSDRALCEAIIVMAHKLGMKVIAEGIETAEQRDLLKAAHCDYGQGYLFSRPVPAEQFTALLVA
jgi:diguanylate cyclase (GGDEF)-like protein/PAS domain S-box-containing protein